MCSVYTFSRRLLYMFFVLFFGARCTVCIHKQTPANVKTVLYSFEELHNKGSLSFICSLLWFSISLSMLFGCLWAPVFFSLHFILLLLLLRTLTFSNDSNTFKTASIVVRMRKVKLFGILLHLQSFFVRFNVSLALTFCVYIMYTECMHLALVFELLGFYAWIFTVVLVAFVILLPLLMPYYSGMLWAVCTEYTLIHSVSQSVSQSLPLPMKIWWVMAVTATAAACYRRARTHTVIIISAL